MKFSVFSFQFSENASAIRRICALKTQNSKLKTTPRALRSRGLPARLRMHAQAGITMLEAIIGIALLIIVMLALTISLLYFYRTNRYAIQQSSAVTSAQKGIAKAVRIIREASYSSEGAFPIVSIGANDFVFYADVDSDPLIERVHYYISGTSLMQGIVDPSGDPPSYAGAEVASEISDYVHNVDQGVPTFRYYNASSTEITNFSEWSKVRFVKSTVVVNVDPNRLPDQITLSSSAAIRNLK